MTTRAAATLVFCTSAAVLVLEILAGRLVAPYVGVSIETFTGVIGTVLAGIALGSAAGGRLADRRDPRRLLGPTVVAGGALALASLPVVTAVGPTVAGGGPAAVVILAAGAFFAPAAVLSAVAPMAAKLRLASLDETGSVVGGLSAAGTAGALVGTFVTGFVLVAAVPTRPLVIGLGAALVGAGLVLWWRSGPHRPLGGVAAGTLALGGVAAAVPGPCQEHTTYYCVQVQADPARPSGRVLLLDNLRHSYVDLDDPTHLEFRYVRLFAAALAAEVPPARPVDALHLGGGGFSFPRYLAATRPGSTSLVLELDAALVALAEEQLGLEQGPGLRVEVGDARTALARLAADSYDVAVGDAFGSLSVPWHLATVEVAEELARALRPEGIYLVNVIDGGERRLVRAETATLAEVFANVAVIAPPPGASSGPANHVLVASAAPLALTPDDIPPEDGVVLTGEDVDAFVAGARALTDDFAPADQLLTRR
ncbi:MAG: fused MFS/spermidine synthase [Actinobacteria bacterium]|nr:fused MFS/spermidine synthase [Actinomycetota bacterium]